MVGVAQRSKGCGTCRRRRVKCDETKPACRRCQQAQIACAGFERWPVFIVRTQSGYKKRKPLEEIKPPALLAGSVVESPSAEAIRYVSWFWDMFGVNPATKSDGLSSSPWLYYFMQCQEPVFRQSLLAVSLTAFGVQFKHPDISIAGRKLYVLSLKSVRNSMLSTGIVEREELPATVCTMVLHEFLDPTMEASATWLAHLDGLYYLVSRRGSHRYRNPASRAVLEHCRCLAMIQSLASRKASTFCLPAWISQPWNGMVKDIEQLVIDAGLQLASLYEKCDFALFHHKQPEAVAEVLESCIKLYENVQKMYDEHQSLGLVAESNTHFMLRSHFNSASDTRTLMLSITMLTIQLGACISACKLINQFSSFSMDATAATLSGDWRNIIRSAYDYGNLTDGLARHILNMVRSCPPECPRGLDSVMVVYALTLASQCLTPDEHATTHFQGLIQIFGARAGQFRALLRSG